MRLQKNEVQATILFFGSARARSKPQYDIELKELKAKLAQAKDDSEKAALEEKLKTLESLEWMCEPYATIVELSRRLTEWATTTTSQLHARASVTGVTRLHPSTIDVVGHDTDKNSKKDVDQKLFVITGGGSLSQNTIKKYSFSHLYLHRSRVHASS